MINVIGPAIGFFSGLAIIAQGEKPLFGLAIVVYAAALRVAWEVQDLRSLP